MVSAYKIVCTCNLFTFNSLYLCGKLDNVGPVTNVINVRKTNGTNYLSTLGETIGCARLTTSLTRIE